MKFKTMAYFQGSELPLSQLLMIDNHPNYLSTYDEIIRPVSKWQRTGNVAPNEHGFGCKLNCVYCNQAAINFSLKGERKSGYLSMGVDSGLSICTSLWIGDRMDAEISVQDMADALRNYPYYLPESPVILENTNDPGLDWGKTADIVRTLREEFNHQAAINFITKMGISQKQVDQFSKLQQEGANLIATVTYAGLPAAIEPASAKSRINAMQRFHDSGIPVVMSMRPMIDGINCDDETIANVLRDVNGKVDIVTVGGLFIYNFTPDAFDKAGYSLNETYDTKYAAAKVNPKDIKERVARIAQDIDFKGKVQYHNSCAISQLMTTRYNKPTDDRLAHWQSPSGEVRIKNYCSQFCPPEQMKICTATMKKSPDEVMETAHQALDIIKQAQIKAGKEPTDMRIVRSIEFPNMLLVENGSLLIEELFLIEEMCGWDVNCLPNREGVKYRSQQAIGIDMGLDYRGIYVGELKVGQEWYVVVNGEVDGNQNKTLLSWLRGRNRARMNIIDINSIQEYESYVSILENLGTRSFGLQSKAEIVAELDGIKLKNKKI